MYAQVCSQPTNIFPQVTCSHIKEYRIHCNRYCIHTSYSLYHIAHPPLSVKAVFQHPFPLLGQLLWYQTFSCTVETREIASPILTKGKNTSHRHSSVSTLLYIHKYTSGRTCKLLEIHFLGNRSTYTPNIIGIYEIRSAAITL